MTGVDEVGEYRDRGLVGDVGADAGDVAVGAHLGDGLVDRRLFDVGDDDRGAASEQRPHDALPDAVGATQLVELGQQRRGRQLLAVDGHGIARLEADLDIGRRIGRLFRRHRAREDELVGLVPRVLEHLPLGGDVQEVRVDGERRLAALILGDGDLVLLGEVDELGP